MSYSKASQRSTGFCCWADDAMRDGKEDLSQRRRGRGGERAGALEPLMDTNAHEWGACRPRPGIRAASDEGPHAAANKFAFTLGPSSARSTSAADGMRDRASAAAGIPSQILLIPLIQSNLSPSQLRVPCALCERFSPQFPLVYISVDSWFSHSVSIRGAAVVATTPIRRRSRGRGSASRRSSRSLSRAS